jgi:8-oxo-dGTP pyrophosphatase MutT (NUDIX family)
MGAEETRKIVDDFDYDEEAGETGRFWGEQGAGILPIAQDTGRLLLALRSANVNEPRTWGIPGGAIDPGEDPKTAAKRELVEELSYTGPIGRIVPAYVFKEKEFKYHNFIAVVPSEFQVGYLDWETDEARWFTYEEAQNLNLHFGVRTLFQKSSKLIKSFISPLAEVRTFIRTQLLLEDARSNLKNQGWPDDLIPDLIEIGGENAGAWVGRAMMAFPIAYNPRPDNQTPPEDSAHHPQNWRRLFKLYKSMSKQKRRHEAKLQKAESERAAAKEKKKEPLLQSYREWYGRYFGPNPLLPTDMTDNALYRHALDGVRSGAGDLPQAAYDLYYLAQQWWDASQTIIPPDEFRYIHDPEKQYWDPWPKSKPDSIAVYLKRLIENHKEEFQTVLKWAATANLRLKDYPTLHDLALKRLEGQTGEEAGPDREAARRLMEFSDGYYWTDLNREYCSIEQAKMGHCGRAGEGGNLWSLRDPMGNPHVTVDVREKTGLVRQLKGKQDKPPDPKYHKYIIALLASPDVVNGKGILFLDTEKGKGDFDYSDISPEIGRKITATNPRFVVMNNIIGKLQFLLDSSNGNIPNIEGLSYKLQRSIELIPQNKTSTTQFIFRWTNEQIDEITSLFEDPAVAAEGLSSKLTPDLTDDPYEALRALFLFFEEASDPGMIIENYIMGMVKDMSKFSGLDEKQKVSLKKILKVADSVYDDYEDDDDYYEDERYDAYNSAIHLLTKFLTSKKNKEVVTKIFKDIPLEIYREVYSAQGAKKNARKYRRAVYSAMRSAFGIDEDLGSAVIPFEKIIPYMRKYYEGKEIPENEFHWYEIVMDLMKKSGPIPNPDKTVKPRDVDLQYYYEGIFEKLYYGLSVRVRKLKKKKKKKGTKKTS